MTFDITHFTQATLKLETQIQYQGKSATEVFETLGDPELIPQWYLLAKAVHLHEDQGGDSDQADFTVEFTFFGEVNEEILHWDPPRRYVYQASGPGFPIKDYVACIEIEEHSPTTGTMSWRIYCDQIDGAHYAKVLPVMLPAINEASMERLAPLIGGTQCSVRSYF